MASGLEAVKSEVLDASDAFACCPNASDAFACCPNGGAVTTVCSDDCCADMAFCHLSLAAMPSSAWERRQHETKRRGADGGGVGSGDNDRASDDDDSQHSYAWSTASYRLFEYVTPVFLSGLSPHSGPEKGGTVVSVLGTGFEPTTAYACRFGRTPPVPAFFYGHNSVPTTRGVMQIGRAHV